MDIRYYLVKNGTDTAAKAPYTIRVVPNGVANLNDLVSEILTRISSSEQRVRMVVTEATKVMLKHVLAGETTPRVFRKPVTLVEAIPASEPKPRVLIGSLVATADEGGATLELSGLENVEAVEGYDAESGQFNAEIFVNGTSRGTDYFMKTGEGSATQAFTGMGAGDTVKVVLKVDPAKTEYDQTPAEATATVTA